MSAEYLTQQLRNMRRTCLRMTDKIFVSGQTMTTSFTVDDLAGAATHAGAVTQLNVSPRAERY